MRPRPATPIDTDRRALAARSLWLLIALCAVGATADTAQAHRRATAAEARAMWRVVDRQHRCSAHHRPEVSTVPSERFVYARLVIADGTCGNGEELLRRRKRSHRWRPVGAGSDWGNPDRCAQDLARYPLTVLRDLFSKRICVNGYTNDYQAGIWTIAAIAKVVGPDPNLLAASPRFDAAPSGPGLALHGTVEWTSTDGTAHSATATLSYFIGTQADYVVVASPGSTISGVVTRAQVEQLALNPEPADA
jgi:hypothetical protein